MRVFHLATDLGPTATGKRLSLLVPALAKQGIVQALGVIDTRIHFPVEPYTPLPLRPFVDVAGWRRIRRSIDSFQPDIVHAWGRRAVEVLNVVPTRACVLKTMNEPESFLSKRIGRFVHIPPIVGSAPQFDRNVIRRSMGLLEGDRVILAADRFDVPAAIWLMIWAMDLIKYSSKSWKLLLIGDGSIRARLERFSIKLGAEDNRVIFLGVRDSQRLLAAADAVWHTRTSGGEHFLLEAATVGVPVIRAKTAVELAKVTREHFSGLESSDNWINIGRENSVEHAVDQLLSLYSRS